MHWSKRQLFYYGLLLSLCDSSTILSFEQIKKEDFDKESSDFVFKSSIEINNGQLLSFKQRIRSLLILIAFNLVGIVRIGDKQFISFYGFETIISLRKI